MKEVDPEKGSGGTVSFEVVEELPKRNQSAPEAMFIVPDGRKRAGYREMESQSIPLGQSLN